MSDWKLEIEATPHYQRTFLAPDYARYDEGSVVSFVHLKRWTNKGVPEELDVEAELAISDGRNTVNFDFNYNAQDGELHLAVLTRLMEQIIQFRQSYADALAIMHGQSVSAGSDTTLIMTTDAATWSAES